MKILALLIGLIIGACAGCGALTNGIGSVNSAQYASKYNCTPSDTSGATYWCQMNNPPFGGVAPTTPSPGPSPGPGAVQ